MKVGLQMIRACQSRLTRKDSDIARIALGSKGFIHTHTHTSNMPLEKLQGVKLPASADFHGAYM